MRRGGSSKLATGRKKSQEPAHSVQLEKTYKLLELIPQETRGIALIALLAEGVVLGVITLLQGHDRFYGFLVFAGILVCTLISMVFTVRRSASQDHNQPNLV